MLKKSLIIIITALIVFALGFGVNQLITNHEKQHTLNEQKIKERVQSLYGGEVTKLIHNGNEYEVEFENELGTYVVALNHNSGEITSLSLKKLKEKEQEQQQEKNVKIGEQRAIEIALEKVNGEVDDVELEMFDGSYVYVVEMEREEDDAIVYVQAYTGEILHVTLE